MSEYLEQWIRKAEGDILNSEKYPEIEDNTLNFILPCHNEKEKEKTLRKVKEVCRKTAFKKFSIFKIKHHFNGYFLVIQTNLF